MSLLQDWATALTNQDVKIGKLMIDIMIMIIFILLSIHTRDIDKTD